MLGTIVSVSALHGCTSVDAVTPDTEGEGESSASASESTEETTIPALLLSIGGTELGHIESAETADQLSSLLCEAQRERLEASGATVGDIRLSCELELSRTECYACLLSDAREIAASIARLGVDISYEVEEVTLEVIPFSTVYKDSSLYYEGTETVETSGTNGEKRSIHRVSYVGDSVVGRELISEETLTEARDELVLVGTKKSTASTGSYAWPTKSVYITSYYGWRTINGVRGYHYGIDLRASVGTPIYAADGGEVIYCGTASGYGKLIKVRHDNGDVTYYAHLSSYSVSVGTRVYKGQQIAKSGNTGRTTGPHLHFELRKGGTTRVDPLKYLPAL